VAGLTLNEQAAVAADMRTTKPSGMFWLAWNVVDVTGKVPVLEPVTNASPALFAAMPYPIIWPELPRKVEYTKALPAGLILAAKAACVTGARA
jgi:hypothetical protein